MSSLLVWSGPSLIDGAPILLVATINTSNGNRKTGGEMVQTYILRADRDPVAAIRDGSDESICGSCMHRRTPVGDRMVRTCYVNVGQGALSVWRSWQRGNVPDLRSMGEESHDLWDRRIFGRSLRMGTYGDPAAVPQEAWEGLISRFGMGRNTGYTHQWRDPRFAWLKAYAMASCDSGADLVRARREGWRVFYVVPKGSSAASGGRLCPASAEAGHKTTCATCMACGGTGSAAVHDIYIPAHGASGALFREPASV